MEHRIEGHKAALLVPVLDQLRTLAAQIQQLQAAQRGLVAALQAEAEEIVGRPLPQALRFGQDGDAVVIAWQEEDLPI